MVCDGSFTVEDCLIAGRVEHAHTGTVIGDQSGGPASIEGDGVCCTDRAEELGGFVQGDADAVARALAVDHEPPHLGRSLCDSDNGPCVVLRRVANDLTGFEKSFLAGNSYHGIAKPRQQDIKPAETVANYATAATTEISTSRAGRAILASTAARAGA